MRIELSIEIRHGLQILDFRQFNSSNFKIQNQISHKTYMYFYWQKTPHDIWKKDEFKNQPWQQWLINGSVIFSDYLQKYCALVERLGFDENFLDVTQLVHDRLKQSTDETEVMGHVYNGDLDTGTDLFDLGALTQCLDSLTRATLTNVLINNAVQWPQQSIRQ